MPRDVALVVGDLILDRWIHGDMARISPEGPWPVVREGKQITTPGGAANVAASIIALDRKAWLLGVVGNDAAGMELVELCGIGCRVVVSSHTCTTVKTRIVCAGYQVLRLDRDGAATDGDRSEIGNILLETIRAEERLATVVFSDYAKGAVPLIDVPQVIVECHSRGIRVVVQTKPDNVAWYAGADMFKPNLAEAVEILRSCGVIHPVLALPADATDLALVAAAWLRDKFRFGAVIVTCGKAGAVYSDAGGTGLVRAKQPIDVCNTVGAGDAFLAALANPMCQVESVDYTVGMANLAAAAAIRASGRGAS